jgi:hypothetical protein
MEALRQNLVRAALEWESAFGNVPHITAAISELDAAQLVGSSLADYAESMKGSTAVQRGFDFRHGEARYQVKANRPSGKPGSRVTLVPKAKNFEWDYLIWILYNRKFEIEEAWLWEVDTYRSAFEPKKRLSPAHYREGKRLR